MEMNRRGFLGAAAGAAAGAASSKALLKGTSQLVALTSDPIRPEGGPERFVTGFCSECDAGCGTLIRLVGDRPVFVSGNPLHPANRRGLCPRGLASLQAHLHPDRLLEASARSDKQQPRTAVATDEAVRLLAERLRALRAAGTPDRVGILHRDESGPLNDLIVRFLQAYGSPHDLRLSCVPHALRAAWWLTQGRAEGIAYDIERAGMVVSFGAALLEGWGAAGYNHRAYGHFRRRRPRGRLVHIEPRRSVTAVQADTWLRIRPGSEGVLALGLAHVLLTEKLHDVRFVENRTTGFEQWHDARGNARPGFRTFVLENYHVDLVAERTGLSTDEIVSLAREMAATRPTVAIPGGAVGARADGLWSCWAIHCLNALLGSVGREGGVLVPLPAPLTPLPEAERDAIAQVGLRRASLSVPPESAPVPLARDGISALLAAAQRPPLDVLIVIECDPVAEAPSPARLRALLDAIPFVVVLAQHPSETTSHADLLIPVPSSLERWDLLGNAPLTPFSSATLRRPVVQPRSQALRHPGQLLLELAGELGGTVRATLPWQDYEQLLRRCADGIVAAQRGDLFGSETEERWLRMMQGAGLWSPSYRSAEELWRGMQERGGWWDPLTYPDEWRRLLPRDDSRFDLAPRLRPIRVPIGDDPEFPLTLYPFPILAAPSGRTVDLPFLRVLGAPLSAEPLDSWVELHPDDARKEGLIDGQRVRVESRVGSVVTTLRLQEGLEPGLAAMPLGLGRSVGRWARGWGVNPLALIEFQPDEPAATAARYVTAVRVVPA